MTEYFEMSLVGLDISSTKMAVNQGIDSRLEGFTRSTFEWGDGRNGLRLECKVHPDEMQVLIRRLVELDNDNADSLADSIVSVYYGKE
jgi:hypothetical protein